MFDLKGKRALVTGSTQGIGYAIARAFCSYGASVYLHGARDARKARAAAEALEGACAITADLGEEGRVLGMHRETGDVDIVVANASIQVRKPWTEITYEEFEAQMTVNLRSTLELMQAYIPAMQRKGWGRFLVVGSVQQYRPHSEMAVYAASKCALQSLVHNVAKQVAPFGVTVNNVAPGAIATPRNAAIYEDDEKRKAVEASIPMGRFGQPEDCVGSVLLLCSDAGAYITGSDIVMDGGLRL